eukprot:Transcript_6143.p1 GENE.Transcript_6143~~Transcript_6143.p1  ORF type:complete len:266 (+),score=50.57 Transcript_6143:108-905(+)
MFWATAHVVLASPAWDERIDPACCPYPEHDPRDYNWPYAYFLYSEVIPDVASSFVPMTELNITFASGTVVEYGKPVPPTLLDRPPEVAFGLEPDRDASTLHTLMMVDPDAPFRDAPVDGEWLHWLVYDIPGNNTAKGSTLAEYAPPLPKPCLTSEWLCLREHRITFILWEQPHGPLALHEEDVHIKTEQLLPRRRYKARDFAARHRLGLQLAMNFLETWHNNAGFGAPWWHVSDEASLRVVGHLIPDTHMRHPVDAPRRPAKEEL